MKIKYGLWKVIVLVFLSMIQIEAQAFFPADDERIQFYGRWDWTNPIAPSHSWPGVYIYAEFEGTSLGARFNDNFNYYNVFIDGELISIFHGTSSGATDYVLAEGLADAQHSVMITKRNEAGWASFTFYGLILDDGKNLLEPAERQVRKIEFLGDSFTSASGNEATTTDAPPNVEQYTNVYEGFGPIIARHYDAQYHMTSISGIGLVLDYQGNYSGNLPDRFNRVNIQSQEPKWDFEQWIPNLVVIGLGLNDYSGFGGWDGNMEQVETDLYKTRYHEFLNTIRDVYPGVKLLAVATHVEWMRTTIAEVVQEENEGGNNDVYYAQYSNYPGGYVNNGHPNVATHRGIANELIPYIDAMEPWAPYSDTTPPVITSAPESPFTSYSKEFEMEFITDSYANLKYSFENKPFEEMEFQFSITGKRNHILEFAGEHGQNYTLFVRASDLNGNISEVSSVTFDIDTTKKLLNWNENEYDDSNWKVGSGQFGLSNNPSTVTVINDMNTVYFRKIINIDDPSAITAFGVLVKGSDASAVYLNGTELGRINFFDNSDLSFDTYAIQRASLNKMFVITDPILVGLLNTGENAISVEMHKAQLESNGVSFNSQMIDQSNHIIYSLNSEWKYFDNGSMPETQLIDLTSVSSFNSTVVQDFKLLQNYPNPFNHNTNINYYINFACKVKIDLFNINGQRIKSIVDEYKDAGSHKSNLDLSGFASGVYFYKMTTDFYADTKALILLK